MNKLSRERVKNNFKWIYVQPTSSSLEIDSLGTVLNCVLFSFPHPGSEGTGCQRARKDKAFHFALVDTTLPKPTLLHLFDGLRTLVSVWPRAGEVRVRGCQGMCLWRFCLAFPGLLLSVCEARMCVQWKSMLGMYSSPCRTGPQPGAWWWWLPIHFLKKPRGNWEGIVHTTCLIQNNEHQVQWK